MTNYTDFDWLLQAIIASLVIPILCIPIKAKWSSIFNKSDVPTLGKIAYRNFLVINSEPIGDFLYKIEKYKNDTWMKSFWFFEGGAIGALFSIFVFISCFSISEIRGFNIFFLLTSFYGYLNYGQKDTDLILVVMSLNLFTMIAMMIIYFIIYFFISIGYLQPKLTEKLSLKRSSKYFYYVIWFSMGILIGFNAIALYFTFWFDDIFLKLIRNSFTGFINFFASLSVACVYLLAIGMSLSFVFLLHRNAKFFSDLVKQKINDTYIDDFPYIQIKTNGENISGKIEDVQNESLVILKDSCTVKAIRWDHITAMEIEKALLKDKITMEPILENIQKKSKWRFW